MKRYATPVKIAALIGERPEFSSLVAKYSDAAMLKDAAIPVTNPANATIFNS